MNPRMRLLSVELSARSEIGEAGRTLAFRDGLNLLRADNSSGKSTALQSIIYALGLEGMLSPSRKIPLPHAMTDKISINGQSAPIEESYVKLQIKNAQSEKIEILRFAVSPTRDQKLITVTTFPHREEGRKGQTRDYFVRRSGAAQRSSGFHHYLAEFLGLDLPRVTRVDGSESVLYLETLFPYMFVEQKHGWSGIQARIPAYLGIRDVGRRSAEYILGLDSLERILQRQRVRSTMSILESDWQGAVRSLSEAARLSRVVIQEPPARISQDSSSLALSPLLSIDGEWIEISEATSVLRDKLRDLEHANVPTVGESEVELEAGLEQKERSLRSMLAISSSVAEERSELERQEAQLELRLEALREDLQRHRDTQVLEKLGSEHAHELLADSVCPTCHQNLEDGAEVSSQVMTAAESIKFIERQIATFTSMSVDLRRVLEAIRVRERDVGDSVRSLRSQIRASRDSLTSASAMPSVAEITRRIEIANRVAELDEFMEKISDARSEVDRLKQEWMGQREILRGLESSDLSEADRRRIAQLQSYVRVQLKDYGFRSLDPDDVEINEATYRPVHEGFDLGFDLSASDMIRLIWAYLFAVLDVGQEPGGKHLGLLVFDEPRQQETAKESYGALLDRAAREGERGAQIIFATSEPSESLVEMLDGKQVNLIDLGPGEKLLQVREG